VRVATFVWATLFVVLGGMLAFGIIGEAWGIGPRVGAATLLITLGGLVWAVPAVTWVAKRSADKGTGVCPVGATCKCGHFNFKPRATCKNCGAATAYG
jgi:hypothetical protein